MIFLGGQVRDDDVETIFDQSERDCFANTPPMSILAQAVHKVAIVTGSARGIGKAIALRLVKDGFNVIVSDLASEKDHLALVVQEAEKVGEDMGCHCVALACDVTQEDQVQAMVDQTLNLFGRLDCMVANAGIVYLHSMNDVPLDIFRKLLEVNTIGVLICFRVAAAAMIKHNTAKGGRLIAASSMAGKRGLLNHSAYCATKFAVRALVQTAAMEYADVGINVTAYAPGMIDTAMTRGETGILNSEVTGMTGERFQSWGVESNLLKKMGQPGDIANLVSFLASEESSFMTGQTVSIDGGAILT